jgi:hypothetical protein
LVNTLDAVKATGIYPWSTDSHFPELFESSRMLSILKRYSASERRLLSSTLYYNTIFPGLVDQVNSSTVGVRFYGRENLYYTLSDGNLNEKCNGKFYLNHNDAGLNDNLKRYLQDLLPDKSRFEA